MAKSFIRINTQTTQPTYPANRPVIIQTPINTQVELNTDIDGNTNVMFRGGILLSPHTINMNFLTVPDVSALLYGYSFSVAVNWLADFAGSQFYCQIAPIRDFAIDLQLNGHSIGTILFLSETNTAVITSVNHDIYNATNGDRLEFIAPSTNDTIAGIYGTLLGSTGASVTGS